MAEKVDCVVIGAGVIGLAVARALALAGREVLILEREAQFGTQLSSRNSGVIHGGIYYPTASLKARLCLHGNRLLYSYCEQKQVGYSRCGKLIVATQPRQLEALNRLLEQGKQNGVHDLFWLKAQEVKRLEPELQCVAALHCASTGVVDAHQLMLALLADAERHGAVLSVRSEVNGIHFAQRRLALAVGSVTLWPKLVVNCAGLDAQQLALSCSEIAPETVPELRFAKGNYYAYQGKNPFQRLVYPLPNAAGLGIHGTLDLAGQLKFGPDVEWVNGPDFQVNVQRKGHFVRSIREFWPALTEDKLVPDFASVRPKIVGPGESNGDFYFQLPRDHGVVGLINLFGMESPGLTSALAIGDYVRELLSEH